MILNGTNTPPVSMQRSARGPPFFSLFYKMDFKAMYYGNKNQDLYLPDEATDLIGDYRSRPIPPMNNRSHMALDTQLLANELRRKKLKSMIDNLKDELQVLNDQRRNMERVAERSRSRKLKNIKKLKQRR